MLYNTAYVSPVLATQPVCLNRHKLTIFWVLGNEMNNTDVEEDKNGSVVKCQNAGI